MMSTGLACDQVGGNAAFSRSIVAGESSASSRRAVDELVDRQHAGPAAIGDDADARPVERREPRGDLGGVEQFGEPVDAQYAGPLQRRLDDAVGARQRAGMGRGRLGGRFVAARLDGDDRLDARGGARRRHELARVGDAFRDT